MISGKYYDWWESAGANSENFAPGGIWTHDLLISDAEEDTSTQVIASRGMASVAQLVEHLTCNQKVVGSNPTRSEVFGLRSSTLSPVVITPEINILKKISIKISYKNMKNLFTRFLILNKTWKMIKNDENITKLAEEPHFGPDFREQKSFPAMGVIWYFLHMSRWAK